jgi:hypothetical protein
MIKCLDLYLVLFALLEQNDSKDGASKANNKTTTRNKSISKSFYRISVKLLCFLYMQ